MSKKAVYRRIVAERLAAAMPPNAVKTSARGQIKCVLTWPFFCHAYDAVFVERPGKRFSYYEHCACCGRARCWVSFFGSNYGKPGSTLHDRRGSVTEYSR